MSKPELKRAYHENGAIRYEQYYLNSEYHREDGPAIIHYHDNGVIWYEGYCLNGKYHREDGPAIIYYHKNGAIYSEQHFLNGKKATKEQTQEFMFNKQFAADLEEVLDEWTRA